MIEFEHVTTEGRGFGLQEISFRLEDGYVMVLAGENGSGKTTLLRHILEPEISYTGSIRIDGMDIREQRNACLNRIAYVSDDHLFPWNYNLRQIGSLYSCLYDKWDSDLLEEKAEQFELPWLQMVESLSRGEKFRMQIVLGMAHGADVFLMDEVTGGMDPVFRRELWRVMRDIAAREGNVLLVSHIREEIRTKGDYYGIMEKGRLREFGAGSWPEKSLLSSASIEP